MKIVYCQIGQNGESSYGSRAQQTKPARYQHGPVSTQVGPPITMMSWYCWIRCRYRHCFQNSTAENCEYFASKISAIYGVRLPPKFRTVPNKSHDRALTEIHSE